jgi:hypothetical protein
MMLTLAALGCGAVPQPPGRTPQRSARRLPVGETLLARGTPPEPPCLPHYSIARLRHDHAKRPRGRQ